MGCYSCSFFEGLWLVWVRGYSDNPLTIPLPGRDALTPACAAADSPTPPLTSSSAFLSLRPPRHAAAAAAVTTSSVPDQLSLGPIPRVQVPH